MSQQEDFIKIHWISSEAKLEPLSQIVPATPQAIEL